MVNDDFARAARRRQRVATAAIGKALPLLRPGEENCIVPKSLNPRGVIRRLIAKAGVKGVIGDHRGFARGERVAIEIMDIEPARRHEIAMDGPENHRGIGPLDIHHGDDFGALRGRPTATQAVAGQRLSGEIKPPQLAAGVFEDQRITRAGNPKRRHRNL